MQQLKMQAPPGGTSGDAVVESLENPFYRKTFPTSTELAVAEAVGHVRSGAGHLLEASFRLDEGGLHCAALDDLAADTSALVACWAGRAAPAIDNVPPYIANSARAWRFSQGRSY